MLSSDHIESAKLIHGTLSLAKLVYYNSITAVVSSVTIYLTPKSYEGGYAKKKKTQQILKLQLFNKDYSL